MIRAPPPAMASQGEKSEPPTKKLKAEVFDDNPSSVVTALGVSSGLASTSVVAPGTSLSVDHIHAWVKDRWEQITQQFDHPLQYLRQTLKSKEAKREFCKLALKGMLTAHPDMRATCMSKINLTDAMQTNIGCSGEAHLLMSGFDRMQGSNIPVFWKGNPSVDRIWDVMARALLVEGLNTTTKQIKLAVARELCDKDLGKQMLFAGYASGSTVGAAGIMLLLLLSEFPATGGNVWSVPEVKRFMLKLCPIEVQLRGVHRRQS